MPRTSIRELHNPRKRFGQHFIADRNILNKIVDAAELEPGEIVLEIGPGLGHLTRAIADRGARVVAVEVDRELAASLRAAFSDSPNVSIAEGDFMSRLPVEWLEGAGLEPPYKVVANIPYYITSLILRRLLEAAAPPTCLVLMVQREVAQNLVAKPPRANLLGISVQYYGAPRIVGTVPAGSFYPRPQVDSAIVRIDVDKSLRPREPEAFFRVVRAGFGGKRKQLKNALAQGLGVTGAQAGHLLLQANVAPERRAETLTLAEWNAVTRAAQTISEPSE